MEKSYFYKADSMKAIIKGLLSGNDSEAMDKSSL
jgi:hypothetical protein